MIGTKPNFFLDTNVLVDYILLNDILKEEDKEHFPLYDKLKPSLDLLNLFFDNMEEIKWSCAPENWQWLRKELNLWKGNRFILPLSIEEQDILMKEMSQNKVKNN